MKAGFGKVCITPPVGSLMYGFAPRDLKGATAIHDDLFVRALYTEHGRQRVLFVSYDLLFFNRGHADRYKGALGRAFDLAPRQILLNTTHTHLGPMLGLGQWVHADFLEPDRLYLDLLERATLAAARQAVESAREVTLWAGKTRTSLPMNRRKPDEHGRTQWAPNPDGMIYDALPFCLFRDRAGRAAGLLFSVSCHPSTLNCNEISADYPGVAMNLLDKHLGGTCSLFLQGVAGETKPSVSVKNGRFAGDWAAVEAGGQMVADAVIAALGGSLVEIEPEIRTRLVDVEFPLDPPPSRAGYEAIASDAKESPDRQRWAQRQIARLDRGETLRTTQPILFQGVQLGKGLRLIAIEAEVLAPFGPMIEKFFGDGVTFPLGYSNGTAVYLPTSHMIEHEGGYEVESAWEYGLPSGLALGVEDVLQNGLKKLL
jgi:hypothetical protein